MSIESYGIEVNEAIMKLEKHGWAFGYLSGHGDAESVTKNINGKSIVIADAEKRLIIVEPSGVFKNPEEETW